MLACKIIISFWFIYPSSESSLSSTPSLLQPQQHHKNTNKNKSEQCNVIVTHIFNNCSEHHLEHRKNTSRKCVNNSVCGRTFLASRVEKQIFSYTMMYALNDMIHACCGKCSNIIYKNDFKSMSEINEQSLAPFDFVFPILGSRYYQHEMYGYYFIPTFDLSSAYYFTLSKSKIEMIHNIVRSCVNLGPLLIICLLGALISGFIAWFIETRNNSEEFPPPFHVGFFEGFWWSFVSMTTVGYGDKTIKSFPGRIFAVLWILVGITICSIFTATLTTEIINAQSLAHDHSMAGEKVGCLNYRANDAIIIAQQGGVVHTIEYNDTVNGIGELIDLLQKKVIHGFLVNKQMYYYFLKSIVKAKYKRQAERSEKVQMIQQEMMYQGDQLAYGMLIKQKHDYDYFRTYFENNWLHLQTCHQVQNNRKFSLMPRVETSLFSPESGLFLPFLYYSLGILGLISCFGVIYEMRRRLVINKLNAKYLLKEMKETC